MKILDIALKDMTRSFRSAMGLVFMFAIPLLVTGMFYFMFGNIANQGDFNLPRINVTIANLDEGGPKLQAGFENIPGGIQADTLRKIGLIRHEQRNQRPIRDQLQIEGAAERAVHDCVEIEARHGGTDRYGAKARGHYAGSYISPYTSSPC